MRKETLIVTVSTVLGLLMVLTYLSFAFGTVPRSQAAIILAFFIGPVAIAGMLDWYKDLAATHGGSILKVGTVYLVIAFALLTLMLVVQQDIFSSFDRFHAQATGEAAQETLRLVFNGVNRVQTGIDVAFDIFYCLGLIFLSAVLYTHSGYGKIFGIFGIGSAVGLLALNLYAFPRPPADVGLPDLGPVTGIWWLAVIVQGRRRRRAARAQ